MSRAHQNLQFALIRRFKNVTAAATKGGLAKFGAADDEATIAAAGDLCMGVFLDDAAIGDDVNVALLSGACIVPVKVAAAGSATRGGYAIASTAGGATDRTIGGGSVARNIVGIFMQSGVAGDLVGLLPVVNAAVSA